MVRQKEESPEGHFSINQRGLLLCSINAAGIHLADAKIDEQFELLSDPYVFQHTVAAVSPLQETMSEFKSQHD